MSNATGCVPGAVPVAVLWRQRTWRYPGGGCLVGVFVEQHPALMAPCGSLTCRAVTWSISQLRREHATIEGLSRQLGTTWKTLWRAVLPRLVALAGDESRLTGVVTLGVDEHVWRHTPHKTAAKGPMMLTRMGDLARDEAGKVHARLLDRVPGRAGTVFAAWLKDRTARFRDGVQVATLDPFRGYANALRDVEAVAQRAVGIGSDVTIRRFEGALHDVVLSEKPVREAVWHAIKDWLPRVV